MRIALRRLQFRVSEEAPNHRQIFAESERTGRERVAAIMDARVPETGEFAHHSLGFVDVAHWPTLDPARDNPGIVRHTRDCL